MSDGSNVPDRRYVLPRQRVDLTDFEISGIVLDIGGGGEGIIGRIKGDRVVAIDLYKSELEEAPPGPLKIIMDARELRFLDESFQTVTAFCSFFYMMSAEDQERVLREAYRVLVPGGQMLIWDITIPPRQGDFEWYIARFEFHLPNEVVNTGYGVPWKDRHQDPSQFRQQAEKVGFRVEQCESQGVVFFIKLIK